MIMENILSGTTLAAWLSAIFSFEISSLYLKQGDVIMSDSRKSAFVGHKSKCLRKRKVRKDLQELWKNGQLR